jgi:hypothetical protein
VSEEEIEQTVEALIKSKKNDLDTKRYQMVGILTGFLKNNLRWANFLQVKEVLDIKLFQYLGPKDDRDDIKLLVSLKPYNAY